VIAAPLLVRGGRNVHLEEEHTRVRVYTEMLLQVVHDYPGIGNWRELSEHEIEFFYDGLRGELKKATKKQ
jgi:hypothetical protein